MSVKKYVDLISGKALRKAESNHGIMNRAYLNAAEQGMRGKVNQDVVDHMTQKRVDAEKVLKDVKSQTRNARVGTGAGVGLGLGLAGTTYASKREKTASECLGEIEKEAGIKQIFKNFGRDILGKDEKILKKVMTYGERSENPEYLAAMKRFGANDSRYMNAIKAEKATDKSRNIAGFGTGIAIGGTARAIKKHREKTASECLGDIEKEAKSKVYNFENSENDIIMRPSFDWANEHAHPGMNDEEEDKQMKRFYHGQNVLLEDGNFPNAIREQKYKTKLENEGIGKHTKRTLASAVLGAGAGSLAGLNKKTIGIGALAGAGVGLAGSLSHKHNLKKNYEKTKGSTARLHDSFNSYKDRINEDDLDFPNQQFRLNQMIELGKAYKIK